MHLKDHVDSIAAAIRTHFPLNSKLGDLTRKCLVKVLQRLALVLLRPKLAAWRYRFILCSKNITLESFLDRQCLFLKELSRYLRIKYFALEINMYVLEKTL